MHLTNISKCIKLYQYISNCIKNVSKCFKMNMLQFMEQSLSEYCNKFKIRLEFKTIP